MNLEADPKDALVAAKQSAHQAGSSETTRWSSLKQSTDQLHPLKGCHVFSRAETGPNSQGANHQHLWDNCESTMRHLDRQSPTEDAASQAFEQPHRTTRNKDKLTSASDRPSLSPAPWLPGRRAVCANGRGESHGSSPVFSLTEMEEDVFKDSPASVSDMDPNLPHFPRQSMCLTVVRETPPRASTAPVLRIYMKGQQIKEEQNMR